MRREIEIGGAHRGAYEDGIVELVYDGDVLGPHAAAVMRASTTYGTGQASVWVVDMSKLGAYTPEARKVLSTQEALEGPMRDGSSVYVYLAGATIKTKTIFSLVLAAVRLLGKIQIYPEFCDSFDQARSKGKAKIAALLAEGKATLPAL